MSFVSLALGVAIAALGLLSIFWPESFTGFLRQLQTSTGLYLAAGFRVALGFSLLLCARSSRTPNTLRVLGTILFVGGLLLPFLGLAFLSPAIDVFLSLERGAFVAWGLLAIAFSSFIAYTVAPRRAGNVI